MDADFEEAEVDFKLSVSVTMLSQPLEPVTVSLYVPAAVRFFPPKSNELPGQIEAETEPVVTALSDRVSVTILSHPLLPVKVSLYVPAAVRLFPPKSSELPGQIDAEIAFVDNGF
jgi:hypothetical protein